MFTRAGTVWSQCAYLKASNVGANDRFGTTVTLSTDGSTLAVDAVNEASAATGIDGDQSDDSAPGAGAVYVFTSAGTAWTQQAYVKASNTDAGDSFGNGIALSADGATMAIGAYQEDGGSSGVGGNELDNSVSNAGAVYLFTRSGSTWSQRAYIKASAPGPQAQFGVVTALSSDGAILAVGANNDGSRGAVYLFH
jgi:hypothetical protein